MADTTVEPSTDSGPERRGSGPLRVFRLHLEHGADAGTELLLTPGERYVLGRAPTGGRTVVLRDTSSSRSHAAIVHDGTTFHLEDLDSRNGTFLDGERVTRGPLHDGAVLRLGDTVALFEDVTLPADVRLVPEVEGLWGPSLLLQRLRGEVALVAKSNVPVLLWGETGAGKERVAQLLHQQSQRAGAFVPVNCAALPAQLAESELFGHVEGAFTGATRRTDGVFTAANGGTLFLDEIGELPLELQPKLLRALATGEVRPVGATRASTVDVRVVAASHRRLQEDVAAGRFREDLYARLRAWSLDVPPLRERRHDVLALAKRFAARHRVEGWGADVAEALLLHDWRFNVRELEQVIQAAALRSGGALLKREHLPPELVARLRPAKAEAATAAPLPLELQVPKDKAPDKSGLELVLAHFEGNVAQVAAWFGKDRKQVYRWAEKLGVKLKA